MAMLNNQRVFFSAILSIEIVHMGVSGKLMKMGYTQKTKQVQVIDGHIERWW